MSKLWYVAHTSTVYEGSSVIAVAVSGDVARMICEAHNANMALLAENAKLQGIIDELKCKPPPPAPDPDTTDA